MGHWTEEVAMTRGEPCWLLYECIQMCVHVPMLMTVVVAGRGYVNRVEHAQFIIFSVWVKPVGVYNQEKQGWLERVCLYVCEVLAPADAPEMERSDLRHVPGAKVKGHHIQTYPEKLSVRERRGRWDHLTNTLTHNIIYYPHPVSLSSPFSLLTFLSPCLLLWKQIIHSEWHHLRYNNSSKQEQKPKYQGS